MPYTDYTPGEVASRGEKIYGQRIRDNIAAEHRGKFVVIDIETENTKSTRTMWSPRNACSSSIPMRSFTVCESDFPPRTESAKISP